MPHGVRQRRSALKEGLASVGDWVQRAEAFRTLGRLLWHWALAPTLFGVGGVLVARLRESTAAQAYVYGLASAAVALFIVGIWRLLFRDESDSNGAVSSAPDVSTAVAESPSVNSQPIPHAGMSPPPSPSRAEAIALGLTATQAEHRATIRRFRELIARVHRLSQQPENADRTVTSLLELEPDFFDLKPYLSEATRAGLFGRSFIVPPDGSTMNGSLLSALKDVDALEVRWGLRPTPAVQPEGMSAENPLLAAYIDAGKQLHNAAQNQARRIEESIGKGESGGRKSSTLPAGVVGISWHQEPTGLHIDAINLQPDAIRDFMLWVVDVKKYSPQHERFVEVPLFHDHGPFVELQLWSETDTQATQIGGVTKLFCGSPVKFSFLYRDAAAIWFKGRTRDASIEQKVIRESGTWQVKLRCEVGDLHRFEHLVFVWNDIGQPPRPQTIVPDNLVSKAPPPMKTLSGRSGVSVPVDPNAKSQEFADVLTERYSFALHNIMNWKELTKGQDFTEADSRQWDEMERRWTADVLELLKAHGCNAQIQAHFRDLHEVPYNQFHHFRYMSEKLSMLSLRLKRLKSIINHYAIVPILD